jgi:O-antigen ligase
LWAEIKASPLIGHGFGAQFHVFNTILGEHSWMGFSHSSYLYIVFKVGFFAALLFFAVFVMLLSRGVRLARAAAVPAKSRIIVRAGVGFLVAFLIDAYASPDLDSKVDVIWLGLVTGYFVTLWNYYHISSDSHLIAFLRNIWKAPKAVSSL